MKLFALEVQIMSQIISELNHKGIHVLYVYDALILMCRKSEVGIVLETMNRLVLKNGVFTKASI